MAVKFVGALVFFICYTIAFPIGQCPFGCKVYYDGCNTCFCNEDGTFRACTELACLKYNQPKCTECRGNLQWNNCTSPCFITCNNVTCVEEKINHDCVSRCECPLSYPIYDINNGTCVGDGFCTIKTYCPNNCFVYFDGCNDCTCYDNGTNICTHRPCAYTQTITTARCLQCKNNLEWICGAECKNTCANVTEPCDYCIPKCGCPNATSILKDDTCVKCKCQCENKVTTVTHSNNNCKLFKSSHICNKFTNCQWKCH